MRPVMLAGLRRLKYSSAVNIVFDGNSLVYGTGTSGTLGDTTGKSFPAQAVALSPVFGSGATSSNKGIGGQTWADMAATPADVDGAWIAGKTNILVLYEGTNSIGNGLTGLQSASDASAYISARLSLHAWKILLMTTIPREYTTEPQRTNTNNEIEAQNNYFRNNWLAMGVTRLVETRGTGSPFALSNYNQASWDATAALWSDGVGARTHLTDAGAAVLAQFVAGDLARIPA